jgi:hypothetical protein
MSKRGHYLGGHTIVHADPRGGSPIPDQRPKGIKKREGREFSQRLYDQVEENILRVNAEKSALRRIEITGEDEIALGCKSSSWPEFGKALLAKILFLRKANIGRADQAAAALNRMGFKTGSGQRWTPRLINVAKMKLFGSISHESTKLIP